MRQKRRAWLLPVMWVGACLGVWLFFRPVMVGLEVWHGGQGEGAAQGLQVLNVVYFLISNGLILGALGAVAAIYGMGLLKLVGVALAAGSADGDEDRWVPAGAELILLGLGLGLVEISLLTAVLGWLGWLYLGLFVVVLVAMGLFGAFMVRPDVAWANRQTLGGRLDATPKTGVRWLALLLAPLGTLGLLAAMAPAGILWEHDGQGFDALEYHLQLPREYLDAGAIREIEHNVYSYMPENAEMLYLLAMVLRGDAVEGMYLGQMLNWGLGVLFVAGVYILLRRQSRAGAIVAALAVAGPQLFFVATNAYVECYLLLMFLLAMACATPLAEAGGKALPDGEAIVRAMLAGIFVGAACGAKYTALATAGPVVMLLVWQGRRQRWARLATFAATALLVFSPWLIKNVIVSGNAIYPLAMEHWSADGRSPELVERWERAHQATDEQTGFTARATALGKELAQPSGYVGIGAVVLAVAIGAGRNKWGRLAGLCLAGVVIQIVVWLTVTHLQSRFLLPMIVPAAFLIGCLWPLLAGAGTKRVVMGLAIAALVASTYVGAARYAASTTFGTGTGGFFPVAGRDDLVKGMYPFSDEQESYAGIKVLLVGESRPFYVRAEKVYHTVFDRCKLAEILAGRSMAENGDDRHQAVLSWLRTEGFTHVFVRWDEVARLQRTYGFAPEITRENLAALAQKGLQLVGKDQWPGGSEFATLYEVQSVRQ